MMLMDMVSPSMIFCDEAAGATMKTVSSSVTLIHVAVVVKGDSVGSKVGFKVGDAVKSVLSDGGSTVTINVGFCVGKIAEIGNRNGARAGNTGNNAVEMVGVGFSVILSCVGSIVGLDENTIGPVVGFTVYC